MQEARHREDEGLRWGKATLDCRLRLLLLRARLGRSV